MNKVLVLLSTYNGERFLAEQLDSLYAQEGVDLHILVRDDGSTDNTLEILNRYRDEYGKMDIVCGDNVGASRSFYKLLRLADAQTVDYDYYSFCDQDDVWFAKKLLKATSALDPSDNIYRFYYCGYQFINAKGEKFGEVHPEKASYKILSFRNPCIGCSQVFSKGILKKSLDIFTVLNDKTTDMRIVGLHDFWIAQLSYFLDSFIVADSDINFSYRQHGGNVTRATGESRLRKIKEKYILYTKVVPNTFSKKAMMLLQLEKKDISREKADFLQQVGEYKQSTAKTISLAIGYSRLFRHNPSIALYAFVLIITRRF